MRWDEPSGDWKVVIQKDDEKDTLYEGGGDHELVDAIAKVQTLIERRKYRSVKVVRKGRGK